MIYLIPNDIYSKLYPPTSVNDGISPFYRADVKRGTATEAANQNLSPFPKETPIAMGYVPFQQWGNTFSTADAFNAGTLFPELDKPFLGRKV